MSEAYMEIIIVSRDGERRGLRYDFLDDKELNDKAAHRFVGHIHDTLEAKGIIPKVERVFDQYVTFGVIPLVNE